MSIPIAEFTPFSEPSYEPRFAFEYPRNSAKALHHALTLHCLCSPPPAKVSFSAYHNGNDWLAILAETRSFALPPAKKVFFSEQSQDAAAEQIARWLEDDAEYPDPPWFDGGEARGFQIYHVPWRQEPQAFYGCTLILPKWFEVHK